MDTSAIISICKPFSMISVERFHNNIKSIDYVEKNNIPGDIVEIGVWKGGSILSMMLTYSMTKYTPRTFHMYDTFTGMTPSTSADKDFNNVDASAVIASNPFFLCKSSLQEVQENIRRFTDIEPIYHIGDILLNTYYPSNIAVLRLDTDWYESTKFELDNFYKYVSPGGIVIVDDYGHWKGCKKAVDEFLDNHPKITLHEIDYTGRYFIKPTE